MTGDEMVGWHHRLKGHEFEQTLGDCEGQGSLALLAGHGVTESDMDGYEQQQRVMRYFLL